VAVVRLPGGWRWASLMPAIPMAYVLTVTIKAFEQQSNLWPLLLLFSSPLAMVYVVVILGLYQPSRD
jgi:predicted permease